jgi:AAA ATPase domain
MMGVRTSSQLLGREQDLAAIGETVGAVRAGEGAVLVLEGPAGIGKTSLMVQARRVARDNGMRVLGARGGELEQDFAFGVVRQLFEPALAGAQEGERAVWLVGAAAGAPPGDPRWRARRTRRSTAVRSPR